MDAATEDPSCLAAIIVAHLLHMVVPPLPPDKKKKKKNQNLAWLRLRPTGTGTEPASPNMEKTPAMQLAGGGWAWLFPGRLTGAGVAIAAAGANACEASETSDSDFYHDQPMEWSMTRVVSAWT